MRFRHITTIVSAEVGATWTSSDYDGKKWYVPTEECAEKVPNVEIPNKPPIPNMEIPN